MKLKEIKRYLDLRDEGDSTLQERMEMLEEHQIFVQNECRMWQGSLEKINDKIRIYKGKIENTFGVKR